MKVQVKFRPIRRREFTDIPADPFADDGETVNINTGYKNVAKTRTGEMAPSDYDDLIGEWSLGSTALTIRMTGRKTVTVPAADVKRITVLRA